jgi:hypothetical protein
VQRVGRGDGVAEHAVAVSGLEVAVGAPLLDAVGVSGASRATQDLPRASRSAARAPIDPSISMSSDSLSWSLHGHSRTGWTA